VNAIALAADFRRGGLNGLYAPHDIPRLADRVGAKKGVPVGPLIAGFTEGLRDRARAAVRRYMEAAADTVLQSDGAGGWIEVQADNDNLDVRALIEAAARAADIPPADLVDIVIGEAPGACADEPATLMQSWAWMALEDFQRAKARRRAPVLEQEMTDQQPRPAAVIATGPGPRGDWRPASLSNPAMWSAAENMPAHLRGLAYIDFDPSAETSPPAWLAKGLLPRVGIGLLFGESGAGKSFAAVHSALCVAWGLPLFGAKVKRGGVLYIAAEGGRSVTRRFQAANAELGGAIAAAGLAGAKPRRAPIRIVTEAPDLSRDGSPDPLMQTIRAAKAAFEAGGDRLALVVLDTWHAALGGGDENSAADAGHALKPLISESEKGDFLTLVVHHPGKELEKGARGSNALPAAADVILAVSVPGFTGAKAKPSSAPRRIAITKLRDGDAGSEFGYRLRTVPTGVDEDGDVVTTCVVEPIVAPAVDANGLTKSGRDFMDAVEKAIAEEGGKRARVETARLMFCAARPDGKPDTIRKAWTRALEVAINDGRVATDDRTLMVWVPNG